MQMMTKREQTRQRRILESNSLILRALAVQISGQRLDAQGLREAMFEKANQIDAELENWPSGQRAD